MVFSNSRRPATIAASITNSPTRATVRRFSSFCWPASSSLGLALWVELTYEPPFWLHLVIFLPLTVIVCLGLLRPLKSLMVALQFHNKAAEGRLEK